MPGRSFLLTRARSVVATSPALSVTVSPLAIPRVFASAGASSTSAAGRWNWSSSIRSTAGPEKSGL